MTIGAYVRVLLALGVAGAAAALRSEEIVVLGAKQAGAGSSLAAMSGSTLEMRLLASVSLKAAGLMFELWQVTDSVALPLQKGRSLAEAPTTEDMPGVITVRLELPEVKRKTQVAVRFYSGQKPSEEIGGARVWVYPPVNWGPVARSLKESGTRLGVFGRGEELRAFLKRRGLEFSDLSDGVPVKAEPGVLAVGAVPYGVWLETKPRLAGVGGRLVVFAEDAPGLPGVYTTASGTGAVTQVTLPVAGMLAGDPRAEDTFLQIIEQQLHSAPAAVF